MAIKTSSRFHPSQKVTIENKTTTTTNKQIQLILMRIQGRWNLYHWSVFTMEMSSLSMEVSVRILWKVDIVLLYSSAILQSRHTASGLHWKEPTYCKHYLYNVFSTSLTTANLRNQTGYQSEMNRYRKHSACKQWHFVHS